jgi:transposase
LKRTWLAYRPTSDAGFLSVLVEFRARLLAGGAERRLFDTLLACLKQHGFVTARGRQRTDSTHVLAAVHVLNRLELVAETLRAALRSALAKPFARFAAGGNVGATREEA